MYNITESEATRILKITSNSDYEVTTIFENGFKAIRKNEWILSEMNVELFTNTVNITQDNWYEFVTYCVLVLKRYK